MEEKKNIFKMMTNIGDMSRKTAENIIMNSEVAKMRSRQEEHKYNIGKIILEKNIVVNDNLINSNLKTINDINNV